MELFIDKAKNHLVQNLPFVLYKKPNEAKLTGLFQKNDTLFSVTDFSENGFVFASFDGSKTHLIPENQSDKITTIFYIKQNSIADNECIAANEFEKNNFKNLIVKGIQAIENNEFKKVVLSRKETINLTDFDIINGFEKLIQLYPSSFVYCFFHPKVGIWLGATPEQLLKSDGVSFETIALAGTQKDKGATAIFWHKKEEEEQQFVTDFIVENVKTITSQLLVSKPYSVKAGTIWHIKTDISGTLKSDSSLQQVVQILHPTPAVCGLPKESSKAFLLNNENYDRTYYTGFLGELNMHDKTDLYVNLRCMEIERASFTVDSRLFNLKAHLFMGCGITKDSIPEKEWEESVNKSMTMKKVL